MGRFALLPYYYSDRSSRSRSGYRKEGRKEEGSGLRSTIVYPHSFPPSLPLIYRSFSLPSFRSYSSSASLFPSPSLSLSLSPHSVSLPLPFRGATMCVVRRSSRQGRLANNTLSGPSGRPPSSSSCPPRPSRPRCRRGKRVKRYRRSRAPGPQIVFYECLHVPVGSKPPSRSQPSCPSFPTV